MLLGMNMLVGRNGLRTQSEFNSIDTLLKKKINLVGTMLQASV